MEKRKPIDLPPDAHAKLKEIAARKRISMRKAMAVYAVPGINKAHARIFAPQKPPRSAANASTDAV